MRARKGNDYSASLKSDLLSRNRGSLYGKERVHSHHSVRIAHGANSDPFSINVPVIEVPFEKWFTTYPEMTGSTTYGPGTMAGAVLSRIDDGVFTHLVARYEITDPAGARSLKAVVQGKAENKTGNYAMNGVVAWGWMVGAEVHVNFQRVAPCQSGNLKVCFRGIIEIQRQ